MANILNWNFSLRQRERQLRKMPRRGFGLEPPEVPDSRRDHRVLSGYYMPAGSGPFQFSQTRTRHSGLYGDVFSQTGFALFLYKWQ